jgi:hypothetical protein
MKLKKNMGKYSWSPEPSQVMVCHEDGIRPAEDGEDPCLSNLCVLLALTQIPMALSW